MEVHKVSTKSFMSAWKGRITSFGKKATMKSLPRKCSTSKWMRRLVKLIDT